MTNRFRPLRRPCRAAVAGFLCLLFSATVAAQQPHSYDITHYDLRIEPDFARKSLRVTAAVAIANPAGERSFSFALGNKYQVTSARASGAKAQVQRGDRADNRCVGGANSGWNGKVFPWWHSNGPSKRPATGIA